ncbi:hypothetical protein D9M69_427670 [compost metagenome]
MDTPAFSSLRISCGTTDSDELVPSTVNSSSRMYFRNFHRLKPESLATPPSTITTNRKQVMYIVPISLPSDTTEPSPYLPTVKAIAPNAAIGARRMIMPTTVKMPCVKESRKSTTGLARAPICDSAMPNSVANTRICRMSFLASASMMLVGTRFIRKSMNVCGFSAACV